MPLISGLVPCNVIAEEILTDHPARYRAMIVESANPAHSLADSKAMREALAALDLVVVIDVAMTETARLAHYVLPASTQYEKWEATFFNFEFPRNVFHLRGAAPASRPRARCPSRRSTPGWSRRSASSPRKTWPRCGRPPVTAGAPSRMAFFAAVGAKPAPRRRVAPVVLYRTLGPTLPDGAAAAAVLWAAAHKCAQANPEGVRRAGFTGEGLMAGEQLFDAILAGRSGVVITDDDYDESWRRVQHAGRPGPRHDPRTARRAARSGGRAAPRPTRTGRSCCPPASAARSPPTRSCATRPGGSATPPAPCGSAPPTPAASAWSTAAGSASRTRRGSGEVTVEVDDRMQDGHVSLPNGLGLDQPLRQTAARS